MHFVTRTLSFCKFWLNSLRSCFLVTVKAGVAIRKFKWWMLADKLYSLSKALAVVASAARDHAALMMLNFRLVMLMSMGFPQCTISEFPDTLSQWSGNSNVPLLLFWSTCTKPITDMGMMCLTNVCVDWPISLFLVNYTDTPLHSVRGRDSISCQEQTDWPV